jgi:WD40 repeat protein
MLAATPMLCRARARAWPPPQGHRNWVLVVAWSPDAQMIASGDMDGSILLWDPKDGKLLGSCSGHKKWITSLVGSSWVG